MGNELVINAASHETRIALIENGTIAELYIERSRERGIVGNIYKGTGHQGVARNAGRVCGYRPGEGGFFYVADVFDAIEEYESLLEYEGKKEHESGSASRNPHIPISGRCTPSRSCFRRGRSFWSRSPKSR
jgi:ribonuclease G